MQDLIFPAWPTKAESKDTDMSRELLVAVVEDDASFRMALVESLSELGYGARGFSSAEEFIAEDGDQSCDCLITDIHLTGMNGFELKRLLTRRGSTKPVIMITAQTDPALETKALAFGAMCLLRKPIEADALIGCLERATNI
jgi:FixJ family two-component response regulator